MNRTAAVLPCPECREIVHLTMTPARWETVLGALVVTEWMPGLGSCACGADFVSTFDGDVVLLDDVGPFEDDEITRVTEAHHGR